MANEPRGYPRREFLAQVAAVPALAAVAAQWKPSAALAQAAVADPLTITAVPEAELVREVESLMRFVDPQIAYRYVPIPPERNAWPLWKQAMEAYVKEPAHFDEEDSLSEFEDGGAPPRPELLNELREWMRQNEPARRLTDEGTAKGAFELPRATKSIALDLDTENSMGLRDLARLKNTNCQLLLLDGRIDDALAEAQTIVRMSHILLHAESMFVDYLIANAILDVALSAACSVAMHRDASREHAQTVVALLNADANRDVFLQSFRVEFCRWFLPELALMPKTNDPVAIATTLQTAHNSPTYQPGEKELAEQRRVIHNIARILRGHPNPIDREATIALANELHLQLFAELAKPYWERSERELQPLIDELSVWPQFARTDYVQFLPDTDAAPAPQPSDEEYEQARIALSGIDNVVGKYMLVDQYEIRWRDSVEMHEVRLKSRQLRIALSYFERQRGELPVSLDALVADGWFAAVPTDPYDGNPFRYSREHRLIWSVGRDGDNDPLGKDRLESDDFSEGHLKGIWRILPPPTA